MGVPLDGPIQRNDVKIVANEEPFGVFVDSICHSTYLRNKQKKQTVKSIQPGSK
jgi:hypothetical protein